MSPREPTWRIDGWPGPDIRTAADWAAVREIVEDELGSRYGWSLASAMKRGEAEYFHVLERRREHALRMEAELAALQDAQPARQGSSGPPPLEPDRLAVQAELDRRKAAGELVGYDALAKHFGCSPNTIRRRLGKLK